MRITHPDGSTYELENEQDVLLYREMHSAGSALVKPVHVTTSEQPARVAPVATVQRKQKPFKVIRDYHSVLQVMQDLEPQTVGRKDIADLLDANPQRISEILADLKRMGLVKNGERPNTWRWQITDRAKAAGWEVKK